MTAQTQIPIVASIATATPAARAWICDIWGVLHNGVSVYPAALDACLKFRAAGGRIVLVSNAPRPFSGVIAQLDDFASPRTAYDAVLTSGDVTRDIIRDWIGIPTLHIGPERDLGLFTERAVPRVAAPAAERILCSGLYDDTMETPENYRDLLTGLAGRKVPMLCANPDIKVDRGGRIIYCAGAIADLYSDLGGQVAYAGKPHAAIYATARALIEQAAGKAVPLASTLAIGDGVLTDIPGGIQAGMPTVYIASAIHHDGDLTPATLATLFPDLTCRPTFAMQNLAW